MIPEPELAQRLQRLEEGLGFAERSIEQIGGELADVNRRLSQLAARVERLEDRTDRLAGDVRSLGDERDADAPEPPPIPPD